jgi:alkylated DNA repair protein (DNA oxidative demethylase)
VEIGGLHVRFPPADGRPTRHTVPMSQLGFPLTNATSGPVDVAPGAVWVPGWLDTDAQLELVRAFRQWAAPPAGLRRPRMPNGAPFSTRAVCLGWHWYPYRYSKTCDDGDGAPVKPFTPLLRRLGAAACTATGFEPVAYDAAIVNLYEAGAKLGLHQDKIEGPEVVAAGSPVVTISLGDRCVFRFGNTERPSRPYTDLELASGDLFVFGGASRLAFHGVPKTYRQRQSGPRSRRPHQRHLAPGRRVVAQ